MFNIGGAFSINKLGEEIKLSKGVEENSVQYALCRTFPGARKTQRMVDLGIDFPALL